MAGAYVPPGAGGGETGSHGVAHRDSHIAAEPFFKHALIAAKVPARISVKRLRAFVVRRITHVFGIRLQRLYRIGGVLLRAKGPIGFMRFFRGKYFKVRTFTSTIPYAPADRHSRSTCPRRRPTGGNAGAVELHTAALPRRSKEQPDFRIRLRGPVRECAWIRSST